MNCIDTTKEIWMKLIIVLANYQLETLNYIPVDTYNPKSNKELK